MKNQNISYLSFFKLPKSTYFILFILLSFHLFSAWQWPMLNDETYYWDWGRNLQLSYVDAPPAVSWISHLGSQLFSGSLGARFLVPFLHFITALFLVNSYRILALSPEINPVSSFLEKKENIVLFIFAAIPLFNLHGILLMPDAPLFCAAAGSLYFALKICAESLKPEKYKLNLWDGILLGCFLGFGVASKYQGVPIAVSLFFAIILFRGWKQSFRNDIPFWILTILSALVISSPLFIWNFQNDFASFKFQGQHGYSVWQPNIKQFSIYLISVFAVLLPWYSYLFVKQIFKSIRTKHFFKSLDLIPIFAFLSIFVFIGTAALGGESTQVHWITPSALFLIPLLVAHWDTLTAKKKLWYNINLISVITCCFVGLVLFTSPMQSILSQKKQILGYQIEKIHNGLYRNLNWANLDSPIQALQKHAPEIAQVEKPYFSSLENTRCKEEPYLVSLSWRWTSQLAFYLPNQPRVFSMNLGHANYYAWRDDLKFLAGCKIMILGEKHMFDSQSLEQYITITSQKTFTLLKSYTHNPLEMIFVEAVMKDEETLSPLSSNLIQNPKY